MKGRYEDMYEIWFDLKYNLEIYIFFKIFDLSRDNMHHIRKSFVFEQERELLVKFADSSVICVIEVQRISNEMHVSGNQNCMHGRRNWCTVG